MGQFDLRLLGNSLRRLKISMGGIPKVRAEAGEFHGSACVILVCKGWGYRCHIVDIVLHVYPGNPKTIKKICFHQRLFFKGILIIQNLGPLF